MIYSNGERGVTFIVSKDDLTGTGVTIINDYHSGGKIHLPAFTDNYFITFTNNKLAIGRIKIMKRLFTLILALISLSASAQGYLWVVEGKTAGEDVVSVPQSYIGDELNFSGLFITAPRGTRIFSPVDGTINSVSMGYNHSLSYSVNYGFDSSMTFDEYWNEVNSEVKDINTKYLKVDARSYNFISTKPLHHSQKLINSTQGYVTIELKVAYNYELETALLEFVDTVEILEPQHLRDRIRERAQKIIATNI